MVSLLTLFLNQGSTVYILTTLFTHTDREFPMEHLAIISKNGTVWDISLNEKASPSKKYLFKLPKSCSYHGYSDDKGVLYFIDGYLTKVIKFHESYNKHGHKEVTKLKKCDIEKSLECFYDDMCYLQSLKVGNIFWMFGALHFGSNYLDPHAYSMFHECLLPLFSIFSKIMIS